jgi:hypothetical protein
VSITLEFDAPNNVQDLLSSVLGEGGVTPAQLMESLYYASDEHVFSIMRIVAALRPEDREELLRHAERLLGPQRTSGLAFGYACARQ